MSKKEKDTRVAEWMKEHKEEVEQVQQRCNALKECTTEELIEMAPEDLIVKVKALLVTGIIAAESKREA